jgi:hypothetical protein
MKVLTILRKILTGNELFVIFFGMFGLLSLSIAISSRNWLLGGDTPFHVYAAFLIDKFHYLPYRDYFSFNFPFVHLYFFIVGKIFGFSYIGIRISDLLYLLFILLISFIIFKKISIKIAVSSTIIFSLIYFQSKNYFSLQPDCVLLIPVIFSILIFTSSPKKYMGSKSFIIGLSSSIASLIKPHAVITFPVLFVFHMWFNSEEGQDIISYKKIIKPFLYSIFGFSLPILATIFFLWASGSLKSFWEIQTNFITLYRNSRITLASDPSEPANNLLENYINLGGYRLFLIPAFCGFYISIFRSVLDKYQKIIIYLFGSLTILFLVYISIAAKFFPYHWVPFIYCLIFLSSLCFIQQKKSGNKYSKIFEVISIVIIFSVISIYFGRAERRNIFINELKGTAKESPLYQNILQTANYLELNLKPGDKVLGLDNVGLANYSMLIAKAEPCCYYPYETVFAFGEAVLPNSEYLHYIHLDYMQKFENAKPRFVLDFSGMKHFKDLQQILDSTYTSIKLTHGTIYQRKDYK